MALPFAFGFLPCSLDAAKSDSFLKNSITMMGGKI
jgi:hypothetical protein